MSDRPGDPPAGRSRLRPRTRVAHAPEARVPPDNRPLVAPIYQSVKFTFDDVDETLAQFGGRREGYYYSRVSNPTLRPLEQMLAELQGRDACLLTGSGVAAVAMPMLALLQAGDHVVYFVELYQPTQKLVARLLARFGVASTALTLDDLDALDGVLAARPTRMVVFESPSNPVLKVPDVERLVDIAHRHGALTIMDNTLAGPHQHGQFDVDVFVHSLTKFVSGHGDVMGGAIVARQELIDRMRDDVATLGPTLDPHAAFLLLRGIKTYFVRREAQCRAAHKVAEFLATHPQVARVRYPGLPSDPGHERARRQMSDFGSMVSFDVQGGLEAGTRFAEALALFSIAASLGSTESLVLPPALLQPRGLDAGQQAWTGIGPGTVRLSIGLEDPLDLVEDLAQALEVARGPA